MENKKKEELKNSIILENDVRIIKMPKTDPQQMNDFKIIWSGHKLPLKFRIKFKLFSIKTAIKSIIDSIFKKRPRKLNILALDEKTGKYHLYKNCVLSSVSGGISVQSDSNVIDDNGKFTVEFIMNYDDKSIGNINNDIVDKTIKEYNKLFSK